jgi:hypothetical protein
MTWIKKRYDQFLLALFAVGLIASAILIFLRIQDFGEKFTEALTNVPPSDKVPAVELERIDKAKAELEKPPAWTSSEKDKSRGSLFVSEYYIIGEDGNPQKPGSGALWKDSLTGKSIPNQWFMDSGLPLLDPTVPLQDADKDGFANEDEWRAGTDPNSKDSHPPYYTKLFLKKFVQVPFRLVFKSYDGDPKKDPIEKFSFQIDTIDLKQPSEFLKVGDLIPNTKYKVEKFAFKEAYNDKIQEKEDVSELTLTNAETGDKIVLIYNRVTNSPDVYAIFDYEWPQPSQAITVKKLQEFVLKPETDDKHHYKLIDINETEAQIKLPDGTDYKVTKDPRKAGK